MFSTNIWGKNLKDDFSFIIVVDIPNLLRNYRKKLFSEVFLKLPPFWGVLMKT